MFNVVYIGSSINIEDLFKKNLNTLVEKKDDNYEEVQSLLQQVSSKMAQLPGVINVQNSIDSEYIKLNKQGYKVRLETKDLSIDPYKNVYPVLQKNEINLPLSGDGQKKIVAYSITKLLALKNAKIDLFFIEEPENHLHRSSLLSLSQSLFNTEEYPYLFITSHSSELLSEMDDVNLIRIYGSPILTGSYMYNIPQLYKDYKKQLNRFLSQALFYKKVLLVEGPSEQVLFEKILLYKDKDYELKGGLILAVNGIAFKYYVKILEQIGIKTIIKTDNDLRKNNDLYQTLGLDRVESLLEIKKELLADGDPLKGEVISLEKTYENNDNLNIIKNELYSNNSQQLTEISENFNIYLSKIDLENDLSETINERLITGFGESPVKTMKSKKLYKMVELLPKLDDTDCESILQNDNFKCLEELLWSILKNSQI